MTTLTIHIKNKKSEKAIKAVLDALGVVYEEQGNSEEYPQHVVDGVNMAKEEMQAGKVKAYNGLQAILGK
ncbi:DUF2683 family protein [Sphingobacterium luzhongxinii]|uniref:DUF2683 family protein n=1 Tax=Sphingobacterium luzhongxinii TaxID=2654181 RepID=UPI0013D99F37|nr:DUF2683 family protein [Sphingobacterium sp. xlx-73]